VGGDGRRRCGQAEMRFGCFDDGLTSGTGKCRSSNGRGLYNSPKALFQNYPYIWGTVVNSLPSRGVKGCAIVDDCGFRASP
jgi:hypothetical protein